MRSFAFAFAFGSCEAMITVCLLGRTGAGKSTFGNFLCGPGAFDPKSGAESATAKTTCKEGKFRDMKLQVIDTPGYGDSKGRDSIHIDEMTDFIKRRGKVHVFLLMLNGQDSRFDADLQCMLSTFVKIFGPDFLSHTVLGFTHWGFDVASMRRREVGAEEKHASGLSGLIKKKFGLEDGFPLPGFFSEAEYLVKSGEVAFPENEFKLFEVQMDKLAKFMKQKESSPCDTRGIEVIATEKEQLKVELENAKRELEAMKAAEAKRKEEIERQKEAEEEARRAKVRAECEAWNQKNREDKTFVIKTVPEVKLAYQAYLDLKWTKPQVPHGCDDLWFISTEGQKAWHGALDWFKRTKRQRYDRYSQLHDQVVERSRYFRPPEFNTYKQPFNSRA